MPDKATEKKCACPKCNCHSGLVHVPIEGEWLVRYGKVLEVIETDSHGNQHGESDEWTVYTVLEEDDENEDS